MQRKKQEEVNKDQQDFDNKSKAVSDDTQKLNQANSELQTKTDAKNAADTAVDQANEEAKRIRTINQLVISMNLLQIN